MKKLIALALSAMMAVSAMSMAASADKLEGTVATSVMAAMAGCMFVRVHDVQANARAVKMTEAICHGK